MNFDEMIDRHPVPRRQLWWMFFATAAAVAVGAELPMRSRREVKSPECEAMPNPFSSEFSADFDAGVGMECKMSDTPVSPELVIQAAPNRVTIARPQRLR